MGFKIKNPLTGEFEKLPILTLKGEKGEPRKDTDDHAINAHEYGWAPFRHSIIRWKTFKEH